VIHPLADLMRLSVLRNAAPVPLAFIAFSNIVLAIVLLFAPSSGAAQVGSAEVRPVRTLVDANWTTGFYSDYFAVGDGLMLADEPVVQSELAIDWTRSSIFGAFKVRGSKGFKSHWTSFSDEVDVGAQIGYSGPVRVSLALWRIMLVPSALTDVHYIELKLSKAISLSDRDTLAPSAKLDYFTPTSSGGPGMGKVVNAGLAHTHAVRRWISFTNEAHFMRDIDGAFGMRPKTNIYSYEGSADVSAGRWLFTPKLIVGGAFHDPAREAKVIFQFEAKRTFTLRGAN
jgi:hypothetical protein